MIFLSPDQKKALLIAGALLIVSISIYYLWVFKHNRDIKRKEELEDEQEILEDD